MGYILAGRGEQIVRRGGADRLSEDDMLLLELTKRAPGLCKEDLQSCFVAMRMEYAGDALAALRTGHVRFQERMRRD